MEALIYFALWAGGFFLMMRLGCGGHVTGHGHGKANGDVETAGNRKLRWQPPERDTDPVCGKTVQTEIAKPSVHDGCVYYFCSRDCREIFEAAPALYLSGGNPGGPKLEHSHA